MTDGVPVGLGKESHREFTPSLMNQLVTQRKRVIPPNRFLQVFQCPTFKKIHVTPLSPAQAQTKGRVPDCIHTLVYTEVHTQAHTDTQAPTHGQHTRYM